MSAWQWCAVALIELIGVLLAFGEVRTAGTTLIAIALGIVAGAYSYEWAKRRRRE